MSTIRPFMDEDFLLSTATSRHLYHDHAAKMPIIDYHCHLSPKMIAGNHTDTFWSGCAKRARSGKNANMSMALIRPAYGSIPFFSTKYLGRYPPPKETIVTIV